MKEQISFIYGKIGPRDIHESLLADDFPGMLYKMCQNLECQRPNVDRIAIALQTLFKPRQAKWAERNVSVYPLRLACHILDTR
jgi:hypothetical protein